jgi:hypothetical protein
MVQFEDYSWPAPTTWSWNFGDGQSSAEKNPAHQYTETGFYNVSLTNRKPAVHQQQAGRFLLKATTLVASPIFSGIKHWKIL